MWFTFSFDWFCVAVAVIACIPIITFDGIVTATAGCFARLLLLLLLLMLLMLLNTLLLLLRLLLYVAA